MATIASDHDLRVALNALSRTQQRVLGGRFVRSVLDLSADPRVHRAVQVALDRDAAEADTNDAFRAAKAVAVATYTDCGKDTDWLAQAAHFVAAAAAACLAPESQPGSDNPAWKAAIQARMARNCALIEQGDAGEHDEPQTQYRLTTELLS